ncbi:uncharacterized protein LOC18435166 [Amborella trichopoda]|uniref:Uncharacterized protein n=1 Tax=Amborella trichopoda TaxID=13333 RepID=W1PIM4_AMBTC|nr:uncharacterized protein LOC18435166 [Amborella trichopoda]ERN06955.1 hypothetical protein AMTR_s00005p00266220 [Amborella trichopoda]|eukprot:XP_006845280.1 uncharacterized protein LOC18435166 [Amborella trichopoda]
MAAVSLSCPFLPSATSLLSHCKRRNVLPTKPIVQSYLPPSPSKFYRPYASVLIVPTGVGASIGGYAGDALPVARALSSIVDTLISHPNVLNAAMLYWPMPNTLYVEGYALDRFAEGIWALQPVLQNKVGLVLDSGIEEELRIRHLQVADAARASLGLPLWDYIVTDTPLEVEKWVNPVSGQSTGRIRHPDSLLRSVDSLVRYSQVNAVAVVGRFPDDGLEDIDDYRHGKGIDLLAGVEAVISHLVVQKFQIPCAHAPALSPVPLDPTLCPKSAAEEIGYTFLPCILAGLSRAPQYVVRGAGSSESGCLLSSDVDSVIVPIDACGGEGTLAFAKQAKKKPLIIAVEENETVLNETPDKLGIEAVKVSNYWEALGIIAAHKAGINPHSLRRNGIDRTKCFMEMSSSNGCVASSPL